MTPDAHAALTTRLVAGRVDGRTGASWVDLERQSFAEGDTFRAPVGRDGQFAACLPDGQYRAYLTGADLSVSTKLDLPGTTTLRLRGFRDEVVRQPPPRRERIPADLERLVSNIVASGPRIVGLGEATHGTAEFVAARAALSFELIRKAEVRLLLFEFDAIQGAALDAYIHGEDVDIARAVAGLGFWITDTHEFLGFLSDLRTYNTTAPHPVSLWGIDAQNTTHPVELLLAHAGELAIGADDQTVLKLLVKRGKAVRDLSPAQRSSIDALLARLAAPRGATKHDLQIAVAARSLAIQLDYWTGDMETWVRKRRDAGMASLASFLVAQSGARRACLWAHDGHISKQPSEWMMGRYLAASGDRYYAVGFYLQQGTTRAFDTAGKIGVISHSIPLAPDYTLEGSVMVAAGRPEIAWLALGDLPPAWTAWLDVPRFTRELGASYPGDDGLMTLRNIREAFDAVAVIRTGHDTSPTPTGVRIFAH